MIRLDKYLAEMSVGTRSEVKKIIKNGRVSVDGSTVRSPETKIDTDIAEVEVDGESVSYSKYEYYMLNKPAGYVSATEDREHRTVVELIRDSKRKDLFPVGRLDIDTEGLLLITNDGELSHRLLSPKKHVDKRYFVIAMGEVNDDDVSMLQDGIDIGDEKPTLPAGVKLLQHSLWSDIEQYHSKLNMDIIEHRDNESDIWSTLILTIHEGRYHQVKRMMDKLGKPVVYLKRISMGSLELDTMLEPGSCRKLTDYELTKLKNT